MKSLAISLFAIFIASCGSVVAANLPSIIPQPQSLTPMEGVFQLRFGARVIVDDASHAAGEQLAERLRVATGFKLPLQAKASVKPGKGDILLTTDAAKESLGSEGYELVVTGDSVVVRAPERAGMFYGIQSLLQLFPPQVFATNAVKDAAWTIPCVNIEDQPRFKWRGMMLDCGRHFFPPADVKRMIDLAALHKLNVFHWHLTEDQGWRIEIKKYPKLSEVGAWRDSTPPYGARNSDDGKRHGGFYTQAEVKDIVAYAAARHITVVPEIEMPGHAAAAIAAYPEFGNSDIPGYAPRVITRWGVYPYIFAPKEETFKFLEDVLTEVCELFPSKFIHIGGDEAPKTQWQKSPFAQQVMKREGLKDEHELQSWFIRRIEKFLALKDRHLIGWDEIQEGGLPKTATMMVWRDAKWAKHALSQGNDVVMATTSHTYLDYYQAPAATELAKGKEFEAIGGFLPLEKVYSYNPAFVAENPAQEKQILGTQCQLWAEYMKDFRKVEYMAFPRLAAVAEVAWSSQGARDFEGFRRRLEAQYQRYDKLGVQYHREAPTKSGE
ncbi:MAG: beta-N-acetylhexosaminidase [Verrucomicrobiota bacterium]